MQTLNYPTVEVRWTASGRIERRHRRRSGAVAGRGHLVQPLRGAQLLARSQNGVGYQVQVEIPQQRMDSIQEMSMVPVKRTPGELLLRDVARIQENTMPGEYDRYNMRRVVSMTANIEGEESRPCRRPDRPGVGGGRRAAARRDRGGARPDRADAADVPRPERGLGLAVVVILLLLTAYFQSPRLAFVAVTTVPAVLSGVVSPVADGDDAQHSVFMGAIMAIGVAVANAILLVTFAEQARKAGDSFAAAREGAGPVAADPDDELRDDRGHAANGYGPGGGRRANRSAGTCRHRRIALCHAGHASGIACRLCHDPTASQCISPSLYLFDPASRWYEPSNSLPAREQGRAEPNPHAEGLPEEEVSRADFRPQPAHPGDVADLPVRQPK